VRAGALASAHDIAEGGLAVALAECCLEGNMGAHVELGRSFWQDMPPGAAAQASPGTLAAAVLGLFGEGPGGFVVSGSPQALRELGRRALVRPLGTVGGDVLRLATEERPDGLEATLAELAEAHAALGGLFA
jgi:phosphoribosylformylglycinamidine (FGAM) synthase-like enzyme